MESKKEYDLASIEQQIPSIIDDFTKYYVFHNKNPDYDEYQQLYNNIKGNMEELEVKLKKISSSIDKETGKLNQSLKSINGKINAEKNKNKQLQTSLGATENESSGSSGMVRDYTTIYDAGYTRNWSLAIGIVILLFYAVRLSRSVTVEGLKKDIINKTTGAAAVVSVAKAAVTPPVALNSETESAAKIAKLEEELKAATEKLKNPTATPEQIAAAKAAIDVKIQKLQAEKEARAKLLSDAAANVRRMAGTAAATAAATAAGTARGAGNAIGRLSGSVSDGVDRAATSASNAIGTAATSASEAAGSFITRLQNMFKWNKTEDQTRTVTRGSVDGRGDASL